MFFFLLCYNIYGLDIIADMIYKKAGNKGSTLGYPCIPGKAGRALPKKHGQEKETPCGYTYMPKKHGREKGKELSFYDSGS